MINMRGIIVNINIDDPVRVWVRTNDNIKRLEKFFFKPIIYLEKRELERAWSSHSNICNYVNEVSNKMGNLGFRRVIFG